MRSLFALLVTLAGLVVAPATQAATQPMLQWDDTIDTVQVVPEQVKIDSAGNVYALNHRIDVDSAKCVLVRKFNAADGSLAWTHQRCSPNQSSGSNVPSTAARLEVSPATDRVYVAIYLDLVRYTARLDNASGIPVWEQFVPTTNAQSQASISIKEGALGHVWLRSEEQDGSRLTRIDPAGNVVWSVIVGPADRFLSAMHLAVDSSGFATITYNASGASTTTDIHHARYDANGNQVFQSLIGRLPTDIQLDGLGNIYEAQQVPGTGNAVTTFLRKYDRSNGIVQWTTQMQWATFAVDPSGEVVTGEMNLSNVGAESDYRLCRYSTGGTLLRCHRPQPYGNALLRPNRVFIAQDGNIVALLDKVPSGQCCTPSGFVVAKYLGTGQNMWEVNSESIRGPQQDTQFVGSFALGTGGYAVSFSGQAAFQDGLVRIRETQLPPLGIAQAKDANDDGFADAIYRSTDTGGSFLRLHQGVLPFADTALTNGPSPWVPRTMADFDGDHHSDIFWDHTDGSSAIWLMRNGQMASGAVLLAGGTGWTMKLIADFNGDGKADILWEHSDGSSALWLMDGTRQIGGRRLFAGGTGWRAVNVGDLNGDGRADILFEHTDGRVAAWLMDGSVQIGGAVLFGAGTGWHVAQVGDMNGDGKADIVWLHDNGDSAMWLMNGTTMTGGRRLYSGTAWRPAALADFNGDGRADILWRAGGQYAAWMMNGIDIVASGSIVSSGSYELRAIGDFNGDGRSDLIMSDAQGGTRMWVMGADRFYTGEVSTGADAVQPVQPAVPSAGMRVEETNAAVTLSSGWTGSDARYGWSGGGAMQSATAGATVSVTFNGTSIRWIGSRGRGMGIASVSIDGNLVREVDLFARPTDEAHTQVATFYDLSPGQHTLTIAVTGRHNSQGDGNLVVVDAFDIQPSFTVSHWQDTNPNLRYGGAWSKSSEATGLWSGSGVSNLPELPVTAQESATAGATITVPFRGIGIDWVGYRGPDAGIAQVQLDGGAATEVDLYSPTQSFQPVVLSLSGLADADHTLTITTTGLKNAASSGARVVVDAFDVRTPGRRYEESDLSKITYSGSWTMDNNARVWSEGVTATANIAGMSATFSFTGTSVSWIGCRKGSAGGTADVFVDGVLAQTVRLSENYPTEGYQMTVFRADGLTNGPHTLMVQVKSNDGSYVVVDAFDVR